MSDGIEKFKKWVRGWGEEERKQFEKDFEPADGRSIPFNFDEYPSIPWIPTEFDYKKLGLPVNYSIINKGSFHILCEYNTKHIIGFFHREIDSRELIRLNEILRAKKLAYITFTDAHEGIEDYTCIRSFHDFIENFMDKDLDDNDVKDDEFEIRFGEQINDEQN